MFATCFDWLSPFVWFYVVLYFSHVPVCCFFQLILLTFGCQQLLTLLILESFILQPTFWLSVMVTVTGVVETDSHLFTSQMPTPAERHMNSLMDSKFVDERSWSSMHARRQNSHLHVSMFLVSILTYILLCSYAVRYFWMTSTSCHLRSCSSSTESFWRLKCTGTVRYKTDICFYEIIP